MSEANLVTVDTPRLGTIRVPEDQVLHFREGILGFPGIHRFTLIEQEDIRPFHYLQSLEDPPITLLVVNPFLLHPAYTFEVGGADMEYLQTDRPEEVSVYAVATIPGNPAEATINLMAPILVHEGKRCGRQVVLLEGDYPMKHPVFNPPSSSEAGLI